jgi:hypothetical protein
LRYFITFPAIVLACTADESGSVDRRHNLVGSPPLDPDEERVRGEPHAMLQERYVIDQMVRAMVLTADSKHCAHRGWSLLAWATQGPAMYNADESILKIPAQVLLP